MALTRHADEEDLLVVPPQFANALEARIGLGCPVTGAGRRSLLGARTNYEERIKETNI